MQEFLCPISLDIMIDPVLLLPTGQIYDYHSLVQWFESGVIPLTSLSSLHVRSTTPSEMQCWLCSRITFPAHFPAGEGTCHLDTPAHEERRAALILKNTLVMARRTAPLQHVSEVALRCRRTILPADGHRAARNSEYAL
jgi:hypothetical protein